MDSRKLLPAMTDDRIHERSALVNSSNVVRLPVVIKFHHTLDRLEQVDRERKAQIANQHARPDRTRPILVIRETRERTFPNFCRMRALSPASESESRKQVKSPPLSTVSTARNCEQ
jgi:hypothetical protein